MPATAGVPQLTPMMKAMMATHRHRALWPRAPVAASRTATRSYLAPQHIYFFLSFKINWHNAVHGYFSLQLHCFFGRLFLTRLCCLASFWTSPQRLFCFNSPCKGPPLVLASDPLDRGRSHPLLSSHLSFLALSLGFTHLLSYFIWLPGHRLP